MGYSPWGHKEQDMTEQLDMLLRGKIILVVEVRIAIIDIFFRCSFLSMLWSAGNSLMFKSD